MKYPIMNKNKPFHNSGVRQSDHTKTYHPRNPGSGKTHNNSGKSAEEYAALAQAAVEQGDRLLAEAYYQCAEHALRIRCEAKENSVTSVVDARRNPCQATAIGTNEFEGLLEKELANV